MSDVTPYNGIEHDLNSLRPVSEAHMPAQVLYDLGRMLTTVLAPFGVRVLGPTEIPAAISLSGYKALVLLEERLQVPVDLGGTKGTLGVRRTKLLVVGLHGLLAPEVTPRYQVARMSADLPNLVERAIAANGSLPDPDGVTQLNQALGFSDEGERVITYGLQQDGNPARWHSREMRIEATLRYWMATDMAGVGSG